MRMLVRCFNILVIKRKGKFGRRVRRSYIRLVFDAWNWSITAFCNLLFRLGIKCWELGIRLLLGVPSSGSFGMVITEAIL